MKYILYAYRHVVLSVLCRSRRQHHRESTMYSLETKKAERVNGRTLVPLVRERAVTTTRFVVGRRRRAARALRS